GFSMGSIIGFIGIEKYNNLFDGAICGCAIGAGSPLIWDNALDVALAYDVAFGWPAAWGTSDNVRNDIDFELDVAPTLSAQVADARNFGKFEFIRLLNQIPFDGFYDGPTLPYLDVDMLYIMEAC